MTIKRGLALAIGMAGLSLLAATPACALQILSKGNVLFLGGPLKPGDSIAVRDYYRNAPKGSLQLVYLASNGGFIVEAIEIGRLIKAEGLSTVVDAQKSLCASACTAIFVAGKQRYYLNAKEDVNGQLKKTPGGLGFHDGNTAASLQPGHYSGRASALMIATYHEFGVPGAAELITKASPEQIYRVSGPEALRLGIATNLSK